MKKGYVMGRAVLGSLLGYVVMVFTVVAGMAIMWSILGPKGAFAEGETVASIQWSVGGCVFGFFAAMVGGIVALLIDRTPNQLSAKILIGFVLVLGLATAVFQTEKPKSLPDGKQMADLSFADASQVASSPMWYNLVIPLVGAAGVLLATKLVRPANPDVLIAGGGRDGNHGQV